LYIIEEWQRLTRRKKVRINKEKKAARTKITQLPADDISSEEDNDEEFDEGGMFLDKESIQLIYNALHEYKPTNKEERLHSVLLEEFEEILMVDYNQPYPDAN
jgi:hypothetical protein